MSNLSLVQNLGLLESPDQVFNMMFGKRNGEGKMPERSLLEAVWEQSIWDYLQGVGKTVAHKKIYDAAHQWIFSEDDDMFSFNFISEHIKGYHPGWFKKGLKKREGQLVLDKGWKSAFTTGQADVPKRRVNFRAGATKRSSHKLKYRHTGGQKGSIKVA